MKIFLLVVLSLLISPVIVPRAPSPKELALASCTAPGIILKVEVLEPTMPKRLNLYFCMIPKMNGKDYAPTTEWTYKLLGREEAAVDKNITTY